MSTSMNIIGICPNCGAVLEDIGKCKPNLYKHCHKCGKVSSHADIKKADDKIKEKLTERFLNGTGTETPKGILNNDDHIDAFRYAAEHMRMKEDGKIEILPPKSIVGISGAGKSGITDKLMKHLLELSHNPTIIREPVDFDKSWYRGILGLGPPIKYKPGQQINTNIEPMSGINAIWFEEASDMFENLPDKEAVDKLRSCWLGETSALKNLGIKIEKKCSDCDHSNKSGSNSSTSCRSCSHPKMTNWIPKQPLPNWIKPFLTLARSRTDEEPTVEKDEDYYIIKVKR